MYTDPNTYYGDGSSGRSGVSGSRSVSFDPSIKHPARPLAALFKSYRSQGDGNDPVLRKRATVLAERKPVPAVPLASSSAEGQSCSYPVSREVNAPYKDEGIFSFLKTAKVQSFVETLTNIAVPLVVAPIAIAVSKKIPFLRPLIPRLAPNLKRSSLSTVRLFRVGSLALAPQRYVNLNAPALLKRYTKVYIGGHARAFLGLPRRIVARVKTDSVYQFYTACKQQAMSATTFFGSARAVIRHAGSTARQAGRQYLSAFRERPLQRSFQFAKTSFLNGFKAFTLLNPLTVGMVMAGGLLQLGNVAYYKLSQERRKTAVPDNPMDEVRQLVADNNAYIRNNYDFSLLGSALPAKSIFGHLADGDLRRIRYDDGKTEADHYYYYRTVPRDLFDRLVRYQCKKGINSESVYIQERVFDPQKNTYVDVNVEYKPSYAHVPLKNWFRVFKPFRINASDGGGSLKRNEFAFGPDDGLNISWSLERTSGYTYERPVEGIVQFSDPGFSSAFGKKSVGFKGVLQQTYPTSRYSVSGTLANYDLRKIDNLSNPDSAHYGYNIYGLNHSLYWQRGMRFRTEVGSSGAALFSPTHLIGKANGYFMSELGLSGVLGAVGARDGQEAGFDFYREWQLYLGRTGGSMSLDKAGGALSAAKNVFKGQSWDHPMTLLSNNELDAQYRVFTRNVAPPVTNRTRLVRAGLQAGEYMMEIPARLAGRGPDTSQKIASEFFNDVEKSVVVSPAPLPYLRPQKTQPEDARVLKIQP